jgi:hypothetical protein
MYGFKLKKFINDNHYLVCKNCNIMYPKVAKKNLVCADGEP